MDIIQNLIKDLRLKGILLSCSGENLEISQVDDLDIEENDINLIRQYKKEIIEYFQSFLSQKNDLEIPNAPKLEDYPVSSSQERLWILSQFPESSVAYNMPFQRELDGDYDLDSFEKAIRSVIDKHEILRTVFTSLDSGEVRQRVLSNKEVDFNIQYIDCSQKANTLEYIETYIKNDSYKPFDLEHGPLLRASLLKASDAKYILYFNMHHIISDGWSLNVLAKDILEYYEAYVQGQTITVAPLKIQYKDYAYWQRDLANNEKQVAQEKYWVEKFADKPSVIDLPTNKVRPSIMTHNGRALKVHLPTNIIGQLKKQCTEEGASLFMGILASWSILFHKYTAHKDITIGSPVAGRSQASLEDQIGFYVNTILFRNQIDPNQSFIDFLKTVKQTTLETYTHQEYPFDKLIKNLELENDASRSKLFDVLLNFQEANSESSFVNQVEREEVSIIDSGACKSKLDLEISFQNSNDDLSFSVIYNTDVYERSSIEAVIHHYVQLLESLLSTSKDTIDSISILSKKEENQLLYDFNTTDVVSSDTKTIINLFEEQVRKNPSKTALVSGENTYTYQELDLISNQLSSYLDAVYTISQSDKIAMMLGRDEWSIISILAIIKLGAVYIPIEKNFPEERKQYIKEDSQYKVCLDQEVISQFLAKKSTYTQENLHRSISPKDLLYIIYTSGTTGKPKGVMITHSNLVSFIPNLDTTFGCEQYQRIGATTNFTFDISILEVLGALCTGKEMYLFSDDEVRDPFKMMEKIARHKIEIVQLTPSRLTQLYDTKIDFSDSIKVMLVGGEAMSSSIYNKLKRESFTAINVYGPTETTIWSSSHRLQEGETLHIGSPLSNEKVYILSPDNALQPVGVTGEICIGGQGVADGYLNKEELTKEKFIDNPFTQEGKIYKTGDLGKWLPDGNIVFLGRKDDQVKILGHRIELGEIENNIQQSGIIQQSIVLVHEGNAGSKQLIAYVLPKDTYDKDVLNTYLRDNLPSYMIPSLIIELSEISLTTSGKLDRKALPKPNLDEVSSQEYIAPRDKNEEVLTQLWMDVLGYEKIGIFDNYFKLGGDSMVAVRLISKINKNFDIRLGVDQLYKTQCIAELSEMMSTIEDNKEGIIKYNEVKAAIDTLKNTIFEDINDLDNIEDVYPMSDIQKGMVFSSILNPEIAVYHDQFVYQTPKFDKTLFAKALELMVEKHSILRTAFDVKNYEEEIQIVYKKAAVLIDHQDITHKNETEKVKYITEYVSNERTKPFDTTVAPLWRASIIDIEVSQSVFIFQFHHAILDGWSIASFNIELFDIYTRLVNNEDLTIIPLECGYKESVIQEIVEKESASSIQFWKDQLSDYKRFDVFSNTVASDHYMKRYESTFLEKIKKQAAQDNISIKSILFGAYAYALKMLTYEEDIVLGLVSNNRPIVEDGDKILGCFLNTLPVRINFEKSKRNSWVQYFTEIEKQQIELKGKDRMPLFEISKILKERSDDKNPFFDVLFNFIDFHIYDDFGVDVQEETETFSFIKEQSYETTNTMLDLTLSATGGALNFSYKLSRKLISDVSLKQLHGYFDNILHCYIEHSEKTIDSNDLLSQIEKETLLVNADAEIPEIQTTTVDLFFEQVEKQPQATALVSGKNAYTYQELETLSNQLASYLQLEYEISKDDVVGMMLDRNEWAIISILAIIKLGAIYVPINKDFPEERKQYLKDDSKYKVCLEEKHLTKFLKSPSEYSNESQAINIQAQDLLYVIYTSGTTGDPKGVMVTHANLVSFVANLDTKFKLESYKKIGVTTSFIFDISILEILGGLCTGKELHLFSNKEVSDPFRVMEKLSEQKIEVLQLTPSRLIQLYDTKISFSESLQVMLVGGEAMDSNTYQKLKEEPFQAINVYGPTETTIWSSSQILQEKETLDIGTPLYQEQMYILNADNALQPKGVVGEICIGGAGVSNGYLNKPELTEEKFIDNPFAKHGKIYKTGDLGNYLPDDNIAFVGRKDDQVKILGHRIELGEIESALLRHESIGAVAVLAKEVNSSEKLLVAYMISETELDPSDLRKFLKEIVPPYMIPSYFVTLSELPLTHSGKLDRKALKEFDEGDLSLNVVYVAPETELQKELVAIWEKVLQKNKIGIHDNFFDLGGHSLLAVKIASEIQRRLDIKVEITKLFLEPNIAELAIEIENQSWQNTNIVEEDVADRMLI